MDIDAIKLIVDEMGYDNAPVILLLKLIEKGDNKAEEALMEDHKFYTEFKQYFIDLIKQETNLTETEIYQRVKNSIFRGYCCFFLGSLPGLDHQKLRRFCGKLEPVQASYPSLFHRGSVYNHGHLYCRLI